MPDRQSRRGQPKRLPGLDPIVYTVPELRISQPVEKEKRGRKPRRDRTHAEAKKTRRHWRFRAERRAAERKARREVETMQGLSGGEQAIGSEARPEMRHALEGEAEG